MFVLHFVLFITLLLCFPVSVGAMLRMIFKKSNARLTALLAAALLIRFQHALTEKTGCMTDDPLMIPDMPEVNGLISAASVLALLILFYLISSLGVELVDAIRQRKESIKAGQKLPGRMTPILSNAAAILLSLSFVYVISIMLSLPWLRLLDHVCFPVWVRRLLWLMPEIVLFCLVGFVIPTAFQTTKRLRWMLALAAAGSLVQWVFNCYTFPESYTVLQRLGTVVPPLLPPWFVLTGYMAGSPRQGPDVGRKRIEL